MTPQSTGADPGADPGADLGAVPAAPAIVPILPKMQQQVPGAVAGQARPKDARILWKGYS